MEKANKRTRFTIIKLSEKEKKDSLSYIRGVTPDYVLFIEGLGVRVLFDNNSEDDVSETNTLFSQGLDCHLYLNYGDLFLSVINALENPNSLWDYLEYLTHEVIRLQTQADEMIKSHFGNKTKNVYNDATYRKICTEKGRFSRALSFATLIYAITNESNGRKEWLELALPSLLLTGNSLEYGAVCSDRLKQNLDVSTFFSEVTMTISYYKDTEEFTFKSLNDLLVFEARQMVKHDCDIKLCQHCNRFFIPANRKDEKYCDFAFRNFKSCKEVAFSQREKNDNIIKTYRTIYKTQNARKRRNSHRPGIEEKFEKWSSFAKQQFLACQRGEISVADMENAIGGKEWMEQPQKATLEKSGAAEN